MNEKIKQISGFKDENDYEDPDLTKNFFRVFPEGFTSRFFFFFSEKWARVILGV